MKTKPKKYQGRQRPGAHKTTRATNPETIAERKEIARRQVEFVKNGLALDEFILMHAPVHYPRSTFAVMGSVSVRDLPDDVDLNVLLADEYDYEPSPVMPRRGDPRSHDQMFDPKGYKKFYAELRAGLVE